MYTSRGFTVLYGFVLKTIHGSDTVLYNILEVFSTAAFEQVIKTA